LLDGDPLVATKFNCHHWMANKMDLVLAIKWRPKPFLVAIRFGHYHWMETEKG
jgi:hypothetical protein